MLFNTLDYLLVFLPIVYIIYLLLINQKNKSYLIIFFILCSIVFYSFWNISLTYVILISVLINYFLLKNLIKFKSKTILFVGIAFNTFYLIYYKYTDYILNTLFNFKIINTQINYDVALPLAISFFTFQQISFFIDSNKVKYKNLSLKKYILHVIFFPQLIAGPIVKIDELYLKLNNLYVSNKLIIYKNLFYGFSLISIGLFKKIIIAEYFTNITFEFASIQPKDISSLETLLFAFAYSLEIYFDFSAYCDMALGSAKIFNIHLPINFNSPYKSKNFIEFWQRWHITLSRFINEYIFRNIYKITRKLSNISIAISLPIIISFFISGLWHRAGNNFILWGLLHGLIVIFNQFNKKFKIISISSNFLSISVTFLLVSILWIPFRISNIDYVFYLFKNIFNFNLSEFYFDNYQIIIGGLNYGNIFYYLLGFIIVFILPNIYQVIDQLEKAEKTKKFIIYKFIFSLMTIILFVISIANIEQFNKFIYFQF